MEFVTRNSQRVIILAANALQQQKADHLRVSFLALCCCSPWSSNQRSWQQFPRVRNPNLV